MKKFKKRNKLATTAIIVVTVLLVFHLYHAHVYFNELENRIEVLEQK